MVSLGLDLQSAGSEHLGHARANARPHRFASLRVLHNTERQGGGFTEIIYPSGLTKLIQPPGRQFRIAVAPTLSQNLANQLVG
jgi:hypothetical protein